MPLTLEQYADYLDTRDLPWPVPPEPVPPRAKPSLHRLPGVRAVMWNLYGTLLVIGEGELLFEHPSDFVMDAALDKTIQEFKMWQSMSRKPGQPAEYMREIYKKVLFEQQAVTGEPAAERVWEAIVKKLFQKEYQFDAGFYGSLNEFARKIAYFFHASLQGTACYPGAAEALRAVRAAGLEQGLLADGQSFSTVQLARGLKAQCGAAHLDELIPPPLRVLSAEAKARKPAEAIFRRALQALKARDIAPDEALHVGSSLERDIAPAKKHGMRTALFAGDRNSLRADPHLVKEPAYRPDVLLTELPQIAEVVG